MTICIAALSDDGKACVISADREITAPSLSLEFEHRQSKIDTLTPTCVAMSSGNALLAAEIIEKTRAVVQVQGGQTVQKIAEILRDTFMAVHLERAEQVILRPRGLTFAEFKQKGNQQLPIQAYLSIDQLLFSFGIGAVEFLICGVDSSGGHIFRVHYSGVAGGSWMEWCDRLGSRAIGSGALHASIFLSLEGHHKGQSIAEAIFNVYAAKKNSEFAPGVGPATDLAVITSDKTNSCSDSLIEKLEVARKAATKTKIEKTELQKAYDEWNKAGK